MTQIQVTKRDGKRENLDLEKIHKVVFWATQGNEFKFDGSFNYYRT